MGDTRVAPSNNDRYIGAMAKALAVEVGGFNTVRGATHDSMFANGFYVVRFTNRRHVDEFKRLVGIYLPSDSVRVEEV